MNKKILLLLPALAMILAGCNKKPTNSSTPTSSEEQQVNVESVEVAPSELSLEVEQTAILAANVKPIAVLNKDVTWTSSNTDVATVDASGKVVARARGEATITATSDADSTKKGTCALTVTEPLFKAAAAPVLEKDFRLGTYQNNLNKRIFFNGQFETYPRGKTTDVYADAKVVRFEAVEGKTDRWYVSFDVAGVKKYLAMSPNHRIGMVGEQTDADSKLGNQKFTLAMEHAEWAWDAERKTIMQTCEQIDYDGKKVYDAGDFYAGTYNAYDTISGCYSGDANFDGDFLFQFLTLNVASIVGDDFVVPGGTLQLQVLLPDDVTGTPVWSLTPIGEADATKVSINSSTGLITALETAVAGDKFKAKVAWGDGEDEFLEKEIEVRAINYGTAEAPLTTAEAKALLDIQNPSKQVMYIKGTVKKNSAYEFNNENWLAIWLDGSTRDTGFEGYKVTDPSTNNEWGYVFQPEDSLKDVEVVISGIGMIYVDSSSNKTYETDGAKTGDEAPKLVKVTEYQHSSTIALNPSEAFNAEQGSTTALSATYETGKRDGVKWSIAPVGTADATKAQISKDGQLSIAIDAVVGAQYTITGALFSDNTKTASVVVTVAKITKITLTTAAFGMTSSSYTHATCNGDHVVAGVTFNTVSIAKANSGALQWQASKGVMYNKTQLPAKIASIVITFNGDAPASKGYKAEFGTSSSSYADTKTITTTAGTNVYTFTPGANTYDYFKLSYTTSGASYLDSVVINFVA